MGAATDATESDSLAKEIQPGLPLVGTELRLQVRQNKPSYEKIINTINGWSLVRRPLVGTEPRWPIRQKRLPMKARSTPSTVKASSASRWSAPNCGDRSGKKDFLWKQDQHHQRLRLRPPPAGRHRAVVTDPAEKTSYESKINTINAWRLVRLPLVGTGIESEKEISRRIASLRPLETYPSMKMRWAETKSSRHLRSSVTFPIEATRRVLIVANQFARCKRYWSTISPCTNAVRMQSLPWDSWDVADCRISNLLIRWEPVSSWFESMPGSHTAYNQ
jgi:hypothetical protein